jgi:hypothetical protein
VFHPPVFHQILERHGASVTAAMIFPSLPGDTTARSIRRAVALDGWAALPRLVGHAAGHLRAGLFHSPPHSLSAAAVFRRFGVPVFRFRNPNEPACLAQLRRLEPDVLFNAQPWLLKPPILGLPRRVSINQHCGDLQRYRGVEPVLRAMLDGEQHITMTLHRMTPEYDSGSVLASAVLPMRHSVFATYERAFAAVPALFDRALTAVDTVVPPPAAAGRYFGPVTDDERRRFRALGLRYL